ncbi:type VII secretion protein EccB [Actinoplanes rectilineatus]|uniref:type VII secretion protein EccB n=1 Tax=Actinoplanes rectilineatus TaxID=113571 RepID=UPI0005F2BB17|nr:type VII secretion protein EccB [Actinoplanes rectilineatus]
MQTQRDHVHAHQFMMGRLSSALVQGDPSTAEIPGRRALTGMAFGVLISVLVVAGFAVYGWIVPGGSKAYTQAGVILVEKESGTRYVFLNGMLRPTPNLTSAMLIQGGSATVKLISKESIKDIPRGPSIGIDGAPQSIATDSMVAGPWLTCLPGSVVDDPAESLGLNLDPRATGTAVPADRFVVVRGPKSVTYLVTAAQKFKVTDPAVLVALGASTVRRVQAPQVWLGFLPDGPDLGPAKIPGAGENGKVGGKKYPVGTLFRQQPDTGSEQLFVLRRDGLAAMSRTEFLFASATSDAKPVELDAADLVSSEASSDRSLLTRLPDLTGLTPQETTGVEALCLSQTVVGEQSFASTAVFVPLAQSGVNTGGRTGVITAPGSGMAVLPAPFQEGYSDPLATYIADDGKAYQIGDTDSAAALKLNKVAAVPFPKSLLALLPQGPTLSVRAIAAAEVG